MAFVVVVPTETPTWMLSDIIRMWVEVSHGGEGGGGGGGGGEMRARHACVVVLLCCARMCGALVLCLLYYRLVVWKGARRMCFEGFLALAACLRSMRV